MSNDKISEELNEDWVISINLNLKVFYELSKHIFKNSKLDIVVHGKDLNSDCLVNWQDLLNGWTVVSNQYSCSLLELALLKIGLTEFHKVGIENFSTLLLS